MESLSLIDKQTALHILDKIEEAIITVQTRNMYTTEPTPLCTNLMDFTDDALTDTRQPTYLSNTGTKGFHLANDFIALVFPKVL